MSYSDEGFYRTFTGRERLKIVLFLILASCILAVSSMYFLLSIGRPYMGISLSSDSRGWKVGSVDTDGLASKVGIVEGDRPIVVNGQAAETVLDKFDKLGVVLGISIEDITVVDNHGQQKSVTLKDNSLSWQTVAQQIALLVISLIVWLVGFYVFFKRLRNAAALLLCLFGLAVGLSLSGNLAAEVAVPIAPQLHIVATVIGTWLLVHFFLILPEERAGLRKSPLVYLMYLPAAITLVLLPLVGWAEGQPVQWFRTVRLFEYGVGFMAAAGVAIYNYFRTVSVRTRQQMRIVLLSSIGALIPILLLNILPFAVFRRTALPPGISILFIGFIPLGMGYAVVTQKLLDIDVIIRRGLIYGMITLVMTGILSSAVFFAVAFEGAFGVGEKVFVALAAGGLATILFGPTKRGGETLVDRLFYKDRYDYRQIIDALSTSLKLVKDSSDISRVLVGTAVSTLNLAGGCLFVKIFPDFYEVGVAQGTFTDGGTQERLQRLIFSRSSQIEFPNSAIAADPDTAFVIPLVAGEKEVGVLCLSTKVSRQDFSSDDLYLLQGLTSVGAMALYGAMLVRDVNLRDTFVSIASHELRTPLTAVIGYADLLLRRDPPDDTRKEWQQIILENGEKIAAMLDDLLDISRIRFGRFILKLERSQLPGILSDRLAAIRACVALESTDRHEFVANVAPDLVDVSVDRDKFGQVVENLLSNAVKYSPEGGRITLSARNEPEQHRVVVSVADEGIGISPDDKDLLFKTFHRIQRKETIGIRGIGLGLYIVKEWTEAMGGDVWFDSELNKGSTFFVAVPTWQPDGAVGKTSK